MAGATGLYAQWCAVDEVTYGVVPSLSTAKFYAVQSDTLELKKVPKQGTGIFQGSLAPRAARRVGSQEFSAAGAVVMELPERNMEQWLYRMQGSYGLTAAALTQDGSTGAYTAVHALGSIDGHSFSVQKGAPTVDGTIEPLTYSGCKISDWQLDATLGDIVKLTMTIEGRTELAGSFHDPLNGSVPSLQAYSAPTAGSVFRWVGAAVYYGGTPSTTSGVTTLSAPTLAGNITGPLMYKQTRPLDLTRYAPDVAPYRNAPLQNNVTQITGSFGVEWLSAETYLAAYQNDTATSIEFQFTTVPIGSGSDVATFTVLVPNVRLEGESVKIPGPQVLTQSVSFTGLDNGADNISQVTYWTLDAS